MAYGQPMMYPNTYGYGLNYEDVLYKRLMTLFDKYYRSGDMGKAMAVLNTSWNSSRAMKDVTAKYFGGDESRFHQMINSEHYGNSADVGGSQQYQYNQYTGDLVDKQGNVVSDQWSNPFLGNYRPDYKNFQSVQQFNRQAQQGVRSGMQFQPQGGTTTGQPGTTSGAPGQYGVPDQFRDMQMLFRDNTGMLHDPGDNPVETPTQPANQPPPWWNPFPQMPPQQGQGHGHRNRPPGQIAPGQPGTKPLITQPLPTTTYNVNRTGQPGQTQTPGMFAPTSPNPGVTSNTPPPPAPVNTIRTPNPQQPVTAPRQPNPYRIGRLY